MTDQAHDSADHVNQNHSELVCVTCTIPDLRAAPPHPPTPAFGVFSTYVALYRRYPRSGSRSYLPTRAAPLALAHKSYLPTPGSLGEGGNPADSCTAHEEWEPGFQKRRKEEKRRQGKERNKKRSTGPLPRGPPPQYYPGSNLLNFAVRMGSGEPG